AETNLSISASFQVRPSGCPAEASAARSNRVADGAGRPAGPTSRRSSKQPRGAGAVSRQVPDGMALEPRVVRLLPNEPIRIAKAHRQIEPCLGMANQMNRVDTHVSK